MESKTPGGPRKPPKKLEVQIPEDYG